MTRPLAFRGNRAMRTDAGLGKWIRALLVPCTAWCERPRTAMLRVASAAALALAPPLAGTLAGIAAGLVESAVIAAPPADDTPMSVLTLSDDTPLLSGPSDDSYATDYVPAGTLLEVVRRDAGGWLAVRPPAGSFSWIPAPKLRLSPSGQAAEVTADDAVAWIGSRVETVRDHKWQVRLRRGEQVAVLGSRELTDSQGQPQRWYQIASPAGEFRWVHQTDVQPRRGHRANNQVASSDRALPERTLPDGATPDRTPPERAMSEQPAMRDDEVQPAGLWTDWVARRRGRQTGEPTPANPQTTGAARAARGRAETTDARNGLVSRDSRDSRGAFENPPSVPATNENSQGSQTSPTATSPGAGPVAASLPSSIGSGSGTVNGFGDPPISTEIDAELTRQFNRDLEDINTQLSMVVVKDKEPGLWNLSPLRARAEALIAGGRSPLDRGRARLMLEKIEQFEQLQQKHIEVERGVRPAEPQPFASDVARASAASIDPNAANAAGTGVARSPRAGRGGDPRFDGTGWLLPVHSTKRVAPPYALMDDEGKVIQYVSPSPGVNLHRYERKKVGIYGQKGTFPSLNAPMLTAQRIVELRNSPGATR